MESYACLAQANFTPSAAAYGAGDVMGAAAEFIFRDAFGDPIVGNSLIRILTTIVKIDITSVPSGQTSYTLPLYGASQPSAQADNDAWTLSSADLAVYGGSLSLGTPVDLGSALYIKTGGQDFDIRLVGSSLWGRLVTDGAHTAAATARQIFLRGIVI